MRSAHRDLNAFARWTERWLATPIARRSSTQVAEGVALARQRRAHLHALIPQDPRSALDAAIPYEARKQLPPAVLALLETSVSGSFEYAVGIACGGDHGSSDHKDAITRDVLRENQPPLRAFTYGDRLPTTTKRALSAHGISLDELMALHENPVRRLSATEASDRGLVPSAGIHVEVAGRLHTLTGEAAFTALREALLEDERRLGPSPGPAYRAVLSGALPLASANTAAAPLAPSPTSSSADSPVAESAWTEGIKSMLYIRARFADEAADFSPLALTAAQSHQATVDTYFQNASYGKTSITTTYTDVVTLPSNAAAYKDAFSTLLSHATAAAKAANPEWDSAAFNLYVVVTSNKAAFSYAGKAWVGGSGAHLRSDYSSLRTAGHEYGHNIGLWHANYWRTDSTSPIGADTNPGGYVSDPNGHERVEYGHRFSLMSAQSSSEFNNAAIPDFSVVEKTRLDWLTTTNGVITLATTPATGTLVRIYRQDHPAALNTRGLRIDVPASDYTTATASSKRRYWLAYRRAFTSGTAGTYSPHGLQIDWARPNYSSDGAIQLDMTPFTRDVATFINQSSLPGSYWTIDNTDKEDAHLPLGLTYSDSAAGIHVTPVATGDDDATANNGNEWIEVDVRLGTFTDNRPPVVTLTASTTSPGTGSSVNFTATASDPDGDALSYWWDFADNTVTTSALNNPAPAKSWSTAGVRVVRVVVSDRRGGQTVAQLPITVGAPASNTEIRGRVLHGGLPVSGARVHIGSTYQTWTDSEGRYILAGLPAASHTLSVRKDGLTFAPQFTNPVSTASTGQYGRDFYANEPRAAATSDTLVISPYEVVAAVGATVDFNVSAFDASGAPFAVAPVFSTSGGGTLDTATGFFTAHTVGTHTVTATAGELVATATITVVAPPGGIPTVSVAATDAEAAEASSADGVFTLNRTGSTTYATTVNYYLGGTATSGADYESLPLTATFAAGQSTTTVVLTPIDDTTIEDTETVTFVILSGNGYNVGSPALAQLTIADNDAAPASGFSAWLAAYPGLGASTDETDDPDTDGLPNLLEYALDGDPTSATSAPHPTATTVNSRLSLTFLRARADLTYTVEVSNDLATWSALATNPGTVGQSVTVNDTADLETTPRRFLRLRVTTP